MGSGMAAKAMYQRPDPIQRDAVDFTVSAMARVQRKCTQPTLGTQTCP